MSHAIQIGDFTVGAGHRPFLIAGPCVIESEQLVMDTAGRIAEITKALGMPYVFKSSFDKANRTSITSFRGPGLEKGLAVLTKVRQQIGVPILTDVHSEEQATEAGRVVDILQIPAFLCRQTDLIVKAAQTGKWVNIKKGQFLAPEDMKPISEKSGSKKIMLTERGTTFGYRNLVVDFRSLLIMRETGFPVVFDATHSLQIPGGGGNVSTGQPEYIIPMARAAMAIGINGLFVETHPNPKSAQSDAGAMLALDTMEQLLDEVLKIRDARA